MFKNEAPYILEWIAYYRVMGVDHFLIYNNDSTDETPKILRSLDKAGIITYIDWPSSPANDNDQLAAYRDSLIQLKGKCHWLAFIDADEFIVPHKHKDLKAFVADYEGFDGVVINWKIFGSSGHLHKTDGLIIERFTKCSDTDWESNRHFKTIAKLDKIESFYSTHRVKFKDPNARYVDSRKKQIFYSKGVVGTHPDHGLIQINHYFTKSKAEWELKRARGRATIKETSPEKIRSEFFFRRLDRNEQRDLSAMRFFKKTKKEIKFLEKTIQDVK